MTALLGLAGFAGYFFLQPLLLGKQFDHLIDASHLDWIPDEARVIGAPAAVLELLRTAHPVRLYSAGIQPEPPAFDYLVYNPKGWEPLPPSLEQLTEPCHPSGGWVVRCPKR
ncbi:hypothetical protein JQX13_02890 [Archangium violaceum]|uniref:hypothetical protein n=1 Tax=Archangium violaceum TaxID=83451 RepID=UPI00193C4C5E|nr:hypothetical protein [Archangium violaceum]QRK09122.1 hypothetical protein JQX13_02890 [Archangium violaceum]